MLSQREAKKELQLYFHTKWKDGLANGLPNSKPPLAPIAFTNRNATYEPNVHFRSIETKTVIDPSKHFVIFSLSNLPTRQASLRGGLSNGTKYTTPGVGVIQLFFSKSHYATEEEDLLTAIASEMFLGKRTTNVWFRAVTIVELAPEEKHFRTNVTFEYEYDTHIQPST